MIPATFITDLENFFTQEMSLKEQLNSVAQDFSKMEVKDETSFKRITSLYAESKAWEKKLESIRKEANAPEQAIINARNDKAKELMAPLKQIQFIAKAKSDDYLKLMEQKKKEEEKEISDFLGAQVVLAPEKSAYGDGAMAYTRVVRKFRTTDLSKVPLKYLQVNEKLVEQDLKLGMCDIPGIEVWEENVTQLRAR